MLCDPRLVAKSYGRLFLDSLPPLPRTRVLADVQRFFDAPVTEVVEEVVSDEWEFEGRWR